MDLEPNPEDSTNSISIVNLNAELTHKAKDLNEYRVHFNLSGTPSQAWREVFEREWRRLTHQDLWQKATIQGTLLVMLSPLEKIRMTHLPILKEAVRAANYALRQYPTSRSSNFTRRSDSREDDRKAIEDLSDSLRFE